MLDELLKNGGIRVPRPASDTARDDLGFMAQHNAAGRHRTQRLVSHLRPTETNEEVKIE